MANTSRMSLLGQMHVLTQIYKASSGPQDVPWRQHEPINSTFKLYSNKNNITYSCVCASWTNVHGIAKTMCHCVRQRQHRWAFSTMTCCLHCCQAGCQLSLVHRLPLSSGHLLLLLQCNCIQQHNTISLIWLWLPVTSHRFHGSSLSKFIARYWVTVACNKSLLP